jgi:hypothetical protein
MPMGWILVVVMKELSQLRILGVSIMLISLPVALDPWREMEQPRGLHCKERGSFIWVMEAEEEREMEIRIVLWLGKVER